MHLFIRELSSLLTLKEKRNRKIREYITKLGFNQHPDSNRAGKSPVTTHLESQLGKGPRPHVHSMSETSKTAIPSTTYNPRRQTESIIHLWANCSSGFMLTLFCSVNLGMLLRPGSGWPDLLQGLNNLKIPPPSYLWCCKSCTRSMPSLTVTPSQSSVLAG